MKKILLIGGGGHATSCIEIILQNSKYKIIGVVEKSNNYKNTNFKYLGDDTELSKLKTKYSYCANCIGQIKSHIPRYKMYIKLKEIGFDLPNFISKTTYFSKSSEIGDSNFFMNNSFINRNVIIGNNNIINTGSIVEHDVFIGDNCHVSTGVILNGGVKIGNNVFIGSGSIIYNDVKIKDGSIIPAGSIIK